jgi:hypothetical protein
MKGLIISLVACLVSLVGSAVTSHYLRPARHFAVFISWASGGALVYMVVYALTPSNLWFLGPGWEYRPQANDWAYGLLVYCLNCHSWIDLFYATCGGFSSAIMLVMKRAGRAVSSAEVTAAFQTGDECAGRIYSWRVPRLAAKGYVRHQAETDRIALTRKGRAVARVSALLKWAMKLGSGG